MSPIEQAIADVRSINNQLHEGTIFVGGYDQENRASKFFESIAYLGHNPNEIVVLSVTPDGGDTVIGRFMTKSRAIYFFDIDLNDLRYSSVAKLEPKSCAGDSESTSDDELLEELAGYAILDERA